jgi:hypothetical protein
LKESKNSQPVTRKRIIKYRTNKNNSTTIIIRTTTTKMKKKRYFIIILISNGKKDAKTKKLKVHTRNKKK